MLVMVYDAWEPLGVRIVSSTTRQGVFNGPLMDELNRIYMGHHRDI